MRKILIALLLVILTMSILWIFAGRQISEFVDRFKTAEFKLEPVHSISYEETPGGNLLKIDHEGLQLSPLNPHVGSTKENRLALAQEGKVFPFGPLKSADDNLAADADKGDSASLSWRHSYLSWPNYRDGMVDLNRDGYIELTWNKADGAKLKMVWLVPDIHAQPSLIRVEISSASQ
jgi:hypothetical protein